MKNLAPLSSEDDIRSEAEHNQAPTHPSPAPEPKESPAPSYQTSQTETTQSALDTERATVAQQNQTPAHTVNPTPHPGTAQATKQPHFVTPQGRTSSIYPQPMAHHDPSKTSAANGYMYRLPLACYIIATIHLMFGIVPLITIGAGLFSASSLFMSAGSFEEFASGVSAFLFASLILLTPVFIAAFVLSGKNILRILAIVLLSIEVIISFALLVVAGVPALLFGVYGIALVIVIYIIFLIQNIVKLTSRRVANAYS